MNVSNEQSKSKLNINWFPGHMTKAKREMQEKLKMVDMVIELRDARIPYSSKNPLIDELIHQKPRIIILTKKDKAEAVESEKWVKSLSDDHTIVLCVNILKDNVSKKIITACQVLMREKIERQKRKGIRPRAIRAMVCGIPNVGKSTLINQLARKRATVTGNRPGVTRSLQWVKVGNEIELLDTPGVLWPRFEDEHVGMMLAITGAINDQILPLEEVAYHALKYLKNGYRERFSSFYEVDVLENSHQMFLNIGIKRGFILKGNEVDMKRVIDTFMKDIRNDKFGAITWEKVDEVYKRA